MRLAHLANDLVNGNYWTMRRTGSTLSWVTAAGSHLAASSRALSSSLARSLFSELPDDVPHSIKPKHADNRQPPTPNPSHRRNNALGMYCTITAPTPSQCHNPLEFSRSSRPVPAKTPRRRATCDRRFAVTDLEDKLTLHIKKRRKSGNGAAKPASEVLAERRAWGCDQSLGVTWSYHSVDGRVN
jgi:hypothetical protein